MEFLSILALFFLSPLALIVLAVLVGASIYVFAVLKPATGATSSGSLTNLVVAVVAVIALMIGFLFFDTLWVLGVGLMAGGGYLLWRNKLPTIGGGLVGLGALLLTLIFLFGGEILEGWKQELREVAAHGDRGDKPLTPEAQAARVERKHQDAELAQVEAVAMAKIETVKEAARLAVVVCSQQPSSVRVPLCGRGMSNVIPIPGKCHVRSDWGGGSLEVQYLSGGVWKTAQDIDVKDPVVAVKYCTYSKHDEALGAMPLRWRPYLK